MSTVLEASPVTTLKTTNTSGLEPLGRAVLVRHYVPEQKGMMIQLPDSVKERTLMVEQRAIVVAVGPACWPDEPPRAAVGDRVLISKLAGYMAKGPRDGEIYQFVNDRDVFARITEEEGDE
jgi:co-chaperonin GroES (HSP10)